MATRPSEKPAWVPSNDPAKIVAPSASKKNTGWLQEEKPPFQYFNWFWNLLDQWIDYFGGYIRYNVVIDSVAAEADYSSIAAYLAAAPAAGDRVLVKIDEVLTATLSIPAGVELTFLKEKKLSTTTVFTPVIQFGNRSAIRGDAKLETSHVGTINDAISFNGDGASVDNLVIENTTTGIVTDAVQIEAGKVNNLANIQVNNTGAGSITNNLNNASTNLLNQIITRGDSSLESSFSAGRTIQEVQNQTSALITGSTITPHDDTIPQITEGNEAITLAVTPTHASNILKISGVIHCASSAVGQMTLAIFQDSIADALSSLSMEMSLSNASASIPFSFYMIAGTISSTTFKIRVGVQGAATVSINGAAGVRLYGAIPKSYIQIREVKV